MRSFHKFLATTVAVLSSSLLCGYTFKPKPQYAKDKPTTSIEYTESNTVYLRGVVDSTSVSKTIEQIERTKSDEVYLFIQSPGGSVIDGMALVNYIRSTEKKVVCIADVAISMAFVTLQSCDERLATTNSIAMQHHSSFGAKNGESPNVKSFVDFLLKMEKTMNVQQAKRIGVSLESFEQKVDRDWWSFGDDLVTNKIVDGLVTSTCTKKLLDTEIVERVSLGFFQVDLTWSGCPLILEPKNAKVVKDGTNQWGATRTDASIAETSAVLDRVLARRFVQKQLMTVPQD